MPLSCSRLWRTDLEIAQPRQPSVRVFLAQKAYVRANAHAQSDLENEVGGWLIGSWKNDQASGQDYIMVERCLPALHTRGGSAHLTFTQDSQVALVEIMEEHFPDKELVGWYHTHPRMSVFLSSYDLFLHNHFFPHPWQVALVIEPHSNRAGFFIRDLEGELSEKYHYGFYELTGCGEFSVVRWQNLTEVEQEQEEMVEHENE
jgi:proteasome lid subunit RPN8/RPN11